MTLENVVDLIIWLSGSNISLNIMYVLSLGVFRLLFFVFGYISINKSVFNLLNVKPCFIHIHADNLIIHNN